MLLLLMPKKTTGSTLSRMMMRSIMPLTLKVNSQLLVSMLVPFNVVDKCVVDQPVSTRGGVVAREVPVAVVSGTGPVEILNALENDLYLSFDVGCSEHLRDFGRDFFIGKGSIDLLHIINNRLLRFVFLCHRLAVYLIN